MPPKRKLKIINEVISLTFGDQGENNVGMKENGEHGTMYFQRTLEDWAKFNINARTKYDASISSGLAIMACQRHLYAPRTMRQTKKIDFGFSKYNNTGSKSKLIQ